MKTSTLVIVVTLLIQGRASAQNQAVPPEVNKLERYLGTWTYEGENKNPVSGGRVTCTSTRRWISGGFFVESHRECKTPGGDVTQVEVYGYDFQHRVFLYWGFNGRSVSTYTASTMDGDTLIWTGTGLSAGNRCKTVFAPATTSSSEMCETSRDGGKTWTVVAAGKSTKSVSTR